MKPKSKATSVKQIDKEHFIVAVKEVAEEGKANDTVIRSLADFFQIEPYQLNITSGFRSRKKIFEIL